MDRAFHQAAPWISRSVLAFGALQFGIIGAVNFKEPVLMAYNHGLGMWSQTAITMTRLQFGILPLAIACIALYCVFVPRRFMEGLGLLLFISTAMLGGYALGMGIDGSNADSRLLLQSAAFDALIYAIGVLAEWRRRLRDPIIVAPDLTPFGARG